MAPVVLVLENSPELRRMLEEGLRQRGYATRAAGDLEEALTLLRSKPVDLLIVDPPSLRPVDGERLLGEIQREFPEIPAILVSSDLFDPSEISTSGETARPRKRLLRRPFTLGEMLSLTDRMLPPSPPLSS